MHAAADTSSTPSDRPKPRPRAYLAQLRPGERADDVFVITNVQLGTKRNGEPFLKMLLCDRTARIASKWWDKGPEMLDKLPDPGIVRVVGRMEDYNGLPQFVIDQLFRVDLRKVDYTELMPCSDKDPEEMFGRLEGILRGMESPTLKALAEAYLADEPLMADLRRAPAAMTFHHACLGGLLEHTLNAMEVALAVCGFYPGLNRDLVIFGIFVHDLAKTWELSYDTGFDYTDGGRLVGHIVKSAMWLEEKATAAEKVLGRPVEREVVDVLQHIVLSHHGDLSLGFGSARSPSTPEAWAVHLIENMDAKLTMALVACRGSEGSGRWAEVRALGGKLFRPDVVRQADAGLANEALHAAEEAPQSQPRKEPQEPQDQNNVSHIKLTNPLFEA